MDEARAFIRQAIEMDPRYALAKAAGAFECLRRVMDGNGDAEDVKAGLRYAEAALKEKDDDPSTLSYAGLAIGTLGYRALGFRVLGFRYDEARRAIDRALQLSPNLLSVQMCAGMVRVFVGEGDAAVEHFERAMRISPRDPGISAFVAGAGIGRAISGRYEQALAAAQRAVEESPNFGSGHRLMVIVLGCLGRLEEAKLAAQRLLEVAPEFTVSRYMSVSPFKDAEFRKRSAEIYLAAGLPK